MPNSWDFAASAGELNYAFSRTSVSWVGVSTNVKITTNGWHHIAVVRPASTGAISSTASTFLNVGASGQSTTYFNGIIDEWHIFNTTRTKAQVAADMDTWSSYFCCGPGEVYSKGCSN